MCIVWTFCSQRQSYTQTQYLNSIGTTAATSLLIGRIFLFFFFFFCHGALRPQKPYGLNSLSGTGGRKGQGSSESPCPLELWMAFSPALSTLRGSPRFDCYFHPALEVYPSSGTFEVPSLAVRVASGEWVGRRWVNFVSRTRREAGGIVCSMCLLWFVSCLLAKPVTPHPFLPLPFPLPSHPRPRPHPPAPTKPEPLGRRESKFTNSNALLGNMVL